MSDYLELLPAVDIAGGQAVQLVQGVAGSEKRFGDPVEAALNWQRRGAEWIHLVDLDAAFGRGHNRDLLAQIVGTLDIKVEMSGGIRDDASLEAAMSTGCRRVNIGTAALEQPEWCAAAIAAYGDRVAVGLDVRGRTLAARGWTEEGGDLYDVLARLDAEGCARYVVTDVNKDGMLQGPNLDLLRSVCAATDRPVVASGGITELTDLSALMTLVPEGVEGAIVGTALYEGRFTLEDGLALTLPSPGGADDARGPGDPLPRRRRRPGGQGHQLPGPARRRRPGRAGQGLRRGGRRRAHLPRHLRLPRGPGHHPGDRLAHRRAGLHPADRRRRGQRRRARRRPAAGRRRQGRGEHRRDPQARAGGGDRRPLRQPGARALGRRAPRARDRLRVRGHHARRPAERRARRASRGPAGRPSSAPARSCSTRWTPTAPRTGSTSS